MVLTVHKHTIDIKKTPVNEKEINVSKCTFEFDENMHITDNFIKEAYFTLNGKSYKQIIVNNECDYPPEVLEKKGTLEIGVVAYLIENDEYVIRYNPRPVYFGTWDGSLKEKAENSEPITPSEMEQYEQALQQGLAEVNEKIEDIDEALIDVDNAINEANTLDLDVSKTDKVATVTLTKKDATVKTVTLSDGTSLMFQWDGTKLGIKTDEDEEYTYVDLKGDTGETGLTPNLQIGTVISGTSPAVTITGTIENPILNFVLEKGETGQTGATGNGIASINKTGAIGNVDTYTITYTNGQTTTFTVTNSEVTEQQFNALADDVIDLRDNQIISDEIEGTTINISGASKTRVYNLKLEKESTQSSTPTPINPQQVNVIKNNVAIGVNSETYTIQLGDNEIVGIGNNKDELIIDKSGHVYLYKKIKKKVLNGTENWFISNLTYRIANFDGKAFSTFSETEPYALSDCFKWQNGLANVFVYGSIWYTLAGTNLVIQIDNNPTSTTLANFKTSLSTNNVTVYYVSATEQLIDLNQEINIKLFKGNNIISNSEGATMVIRYVESTEDVIDNKQDLLISGTNIKTINNQSLLGSGNINISGGGTSVDVQINNTSIVDNDVANIKTKGVYNSSTNKIATESDIPDITGKQDTIDSSHKLSSDLVDDTNATNKFFSGNYNDLSNKPTNVSTFTNDAGYLTQHQDISGKLDTSKVKAITSTTNGDVYDVTYINTMLGNIESLLGGI